MLEKAYPVPVSLHHRAVDPRQWCQIFPFMLSTTLLKMSHNPLHTPLQMCFSRVLARSSEQCLTASIPTFYFYFSQAVSRRLVALEETNNRHQCQSDKLTHERQAPKQNSVSPSDWPTPKRGETTPSSRGQLSLKKWSTPSFRLPELDTKQGGPQRKEGKPSFRRRHKNV